MVIKRHNNYTDRAVSRLRFHLMWIRSTWKRIIIMSHNCRAHTNLWWWRWWQRIWRSSPSPTCCDACRRWWSHLDLRPPTRSGECTPTITHNKNPSTNHWDDRGWPRPIQMFSRVILGPEWKLVHRGTPCANNPNLAGVWRHAPSDSARRRVSMWRRHCLRLLLTHDKHESTFRGAGLVTWSASSSFRPDGGFLFVIRKNRSRRARATSLAFALAQCVKAQIYNGHWDTTGNCMSIRANTFDFMAALGSQAVCAKSLRKQIHLSVKRAASESRWVHYLQNLLQPVLCQAGVLLQHVLLLLDVSVPGRRPVGLLQDLEQRGADRQVENDARG